MTAADGAEALGMDELAVVDVIAGLTARDFDKSMPSEVNPAVWQDVYKPVIGDRALYVKFTLDARGELLLISFNENGPWAIHAIIRTSLPAPRAAGSCGAA
jgi:motility quorum-sensing regulator/GCU-specific mRNA interferase toxin